MVKNTLVCPFLDDSPAYALGVEFGLLYARMRDADGPIEDYFTRANQDQILLLASRSGWIVADMKPWDKSWFWCRLKKIPTPA